MCVPYTDLCVPYTDLRYDFNKTIQVWSQTFRCKRDAVLDVPHQRSLRTGWRRYASNYLDPGGQEIYLGYLGREDTMDVEGAGNNAGDAR